MQEQDTDRTEYRANPSNGVPTDSRLALWIRFIDVVGAVADRVSWPGLILLFIFFVLCTFPSDAQKHEIIDQYVLGKDGWALREELIVGAVVVLVFFAQNQIWKRRVKKLEDINSQLQSRNDQLEKTIIELKGHEASHEQEVGE